MTSKLNENEINAKLSEFDGWEYVSGKLCGSFKFRNFAEALAFVNKIGVIAEKQNHHPDIEMGWGRANIAYVTHDVGGISEKDFSAIAEISKI